MKRRLTVILLAVAACIVAAYQSGLYPASGQTPTPTTAEPLGSISGRVFVDVDINGSFGGPDVPLGLPLDLVLVDAPFATGVSSSDGAYEFRELPPGNYNLFISLPQIACALPSGIPPFDWAGDVNRLFLCGNPQFSTPSKFVGLGVGETITNVDLPQLPTSDEIAGRVWLNAASLTIQNSVKVTAGGKVCWDAQVSAGATLAGVPVSRYSARLEPFNDPGCHSGNLDISIDGQAEGIAKPWEEFWRESLIPYGSRPLGFVQDISIPGFLGISGQVAEATTVTTENVARHEGNLMPDGTEIWAFVGSTLCGAVKTKALRSNPSQAQPAGEFGGNLFGLIVPPSSVKPGCGTADAQVTFCIGDFKARQPAAGPFSYFQSAEAKPVGWSAPALADITLEPTTQACLASAPPPELPISLPQTGGSP